MGNMKIYQYECKRIGPAGGMEIVCTDYELEHHNRRFNMDGSLKEETYEFVNNDGFHILLKADDLDEVNTILGSGRPMVFSLDDSSSENGAKFVSSLFQAYFNEQKKEDAEIER